MQLNLPSANIVQIVYMDNFIRFQLQIVMVSLDSLLLRTNRSSNSIFSIQIMRYQEKLTLIKS